MATGSSDRIIRVAIGADPSDDRIVILGAGFTADQARILARDILARADEDRFCLPSLGARLCLKLLRS